MNKWKRVSWVWLVCFLTLGVVISRANAQEGEGGGEWLNLLRPPAWLSDFNPIGHMFDPIEEAVPNLYIKGLIWNYTRVPLKGKSYRDSQDLQWGQTGRDRHWDFDSIEFLGELELRWKPTPTLEFVNIWNQLYDGIYDWDHYWRNDKKNKTRYVERELEYYRSYKRYLRELYVRWAASPRLTITAGKQQQVWGKIDFQLIDLINPNDRRLGNIYRLTDAEQRRIPTWMVDARYQLGESAYIEATWNPDFEPEPDLATGKLLGWVYDTQNNPQHPTPGPSLVRRLKDDKPSAAFQNHEWFLRGGFNWKGFDFMPFYGYYWSDLPVLFFKHFNPAVLAGAAAPPVVEIAPKHTRQHSLGLAFDKNFNFFGRPVLLIYENKYDLDVYLPEFRNQGELFSILSRQTGTGRDDAWRKMNMMIQGLEFDTVWGPRQHYSLVFGAFNVHVFKWGGNVPVPNARHRNLTVPFYAISIPIWLLEDRLQFIHSANFMAEDGGGQTLVEMTYKFSNYISTSIRWYNNWGNQNDQPNGVMRDRNMMAFWFKYEF